MLVSMYPGTITFARILAPEEDKFDSATMALVKAITPALVDAYAATPTPPLDACKDDMLMIHFDPA